MVTIELVLSVLTNEWQKHDYIIDILKQKDTVMKDYDSFHGQTIAKLIDELVMLGKVERHIEYTEKKGNPKIFYRLTYHKIEQVSKESIFNELKELWYDEEYSRYNFPFFFGLVIRPEYMLNATRVDAEIRLQMYMKLSNEDLLSKIKRLKEKLISKRVIKK